MFGIFGGKKNNQDSAGLRKYKELKESFKNRELRDAMERVALGETRMPLSIASEAQNAVANINYLVNLIGVSGSDLIGAISTTSYDKKLTEMILHNEKDRAKAFNDDADWVHELVSWAKKNNLPELKPFDSPAYRQTGFPRDAAGFASLVCIHLPGCGLKTIPDAIGNLKNVQAICLDNNELESLPACIGTLQGLIRLDIDDNSIKMLPREIGGLSNLQTISMRNNPIEDFPIEMLKLNSLRKLDVKGAKIHLSSKYSPLSEDGFNVYNHFYEIISEESPDYWLKNTDVSALTETG